MNTVIRWIRGGFDGPLSAVTAATLGMASGYIAITTLLVIFAGEGLARRFGLPPAALVAANATSSVGVGLGNLYFTFRGGNPGRGPKVKLWAVAGGSILSLLGLAVVPGTAPPSVIAAALALAVGAFGFCAGGVNYVTQSNVQMNVHPARRSEAAGQWQTFTQIGTVVFGLALSLVAARFDWWGGVLLIGTLAAPFGLIYALRAELSIPSRPRRASAQEVVALGRPVFPALAATVVTYLAWEIAYILPGFHGASALVIGVVTTVPVIASAPFILALGRWADAAPRRVAAVGAVLVLTSIAVIATAPPWVGGDAGWTAVGVGFLGVELGSNGLGSMLKAKLASHGDPIRQQLLGLAVRFMAAGVSGWLLSAVWSVLLLVVGTSRGASIALAILNAAALGTVMVLTIIRPAKRGLKRLWPGVTDGAIVIAVLGAENEETLVRHLAVKMGADRWAVYALLREERLMWTLSAPGGRERRALSLTRVAAGRRRRFTPTGSFSTRQIGSRPIVLVSGESGAVARLRASIPGVTVDVNVKEWRHLPDDLKAVVETNAALADNAGLKRPATFYTIHGVSGGPVTLTPFGNDRVVALT
jgi:hypothetical protein